MHILPTLLVGVSVFTASAGWLHAADVAPPDTQLKRLTLEELGQIRITSASKEPEEVHQTPAAIYVLTHDDIRRSGATSVPDALRFVPGVQVARIDSSRNWVVGIRGFGDQYSKSMLVLIDGRGLYTPLFGGVHWSLHDLLLDDIERIEVIRGPGATVWGANAVNGVVNIITRSADQTRGSMATFAAGTVDQVIAGARYGARLSDRASYRLYGKGFKRGPEWHSDGREFDRWHMAQGGFRVDWARTDRESLSVHGDAYGGEIGESVLVARFAPPGRTLVDAPVAVSGQNVVARWERRRDDGSGLSVQGYWDRTYRLGTDFGETRNTFDVDLVDRRRVSARHELTWGGGMRLSPSRYVQTIEAADFQPHDQHDNLFSAFGEDAISLPWKLKASLGTKLEHNRHTGLEIQPSASLLWVPTPHQSAWVAVARAVRTPSRIDTDISVEQFFTAGPPAVYARILGNPAIKSESLRSLEAGYRALLTPRVWVDLTAFRHQYADLVALGPARIDSPTRDALTYTRVSFELTNGIDGPTKGLEIAPRVTLGRNVEARASYSWLGTDLTRRTGIPDNSFSALTIAGSPHHQAVIQTLVTAGPLQLSPTYRFVSRRASMDIDAYHELDVPVAWQATPQFAVSLVGQNLLHAYHSEWARDPGPTVSIRRSVYVRVTWKSTP